jgi:SAM-dependent methyltransferase
VDAGSIDRARADRVLMHLDSPPRAIADLRRVLRPRGLLTLSEPDWDTLAIDHPGLAISRAFTRFIAERANRKQAMGRQLARLAAAGGFTILAVHNASPAFTDFAAAETILGLCRNTERAITAGYLTPEAGRQWVTHLTTQPFTDACIMITVLAQA